MVALKTKYYYKQNEIKYIEKPVLKCLRYYNKTILLLYFTGCTEWQIKKKFY